MNGEREEIFQRIAMLLGEAKYILEDHLEDKFDNEIFSDAANTAFVNLGEIAGNMWAIAMDEPEDIYL